MSTTTFCEQCGASTDAAARFCTNCGAEQHDREHAASDTPSPEEASAGAWASTAEPSPEAGVGGAAQLPTIKGLPLELWLVIAAFAVPGAWLAIDVIRALPDAVKVLGSSFLGFRLGLALMLILLLVGAVGVAMLAIAWRLYRRDRVGRGLAYALAATIVWSVALSSSGSTAQTLAMLFSLAAVAILAFAPRVRAIFDQAASVDGTPTSVVVSRTGIAIFSAIAGAVAVIYLLLASVDGKYAIAAVIAASAAIAAMITSRRLSHGDRQARLQLTVGGAAVAILLIALGRAELGLLFPEGLIIAVIGTLWLPNDARAFFGDAPLSVGLS